MRKGSGAYICRVVSIILCLQITLCQLYRQCQNNGKKIMVRNIYPPYALQYKCLCPFTYYGNQCENLREVHCFINNQRIVKFNAKQKQNQNQANLSFMIECYLSKFSFQNRPFGLSNNVYQLPVSPQFIEKQLKQTNYHIGPSYQIVWNNSSSIFNSQGEIIRNQTTQNMTDSQILDSYKHYQFDYQSDLFGFPLNNAQIRYELYVEQFNGTRGLFLVDNPIITYQYIKIPSVKPNENANSTRTIGSFSVKINKQWQEYKVTRLQLIMKLYYNVEGKAEIYHRIGMNSGKWLVYDPNFQRGARISFQKYRIPNSFYVIMAFIGIFVLMWMGRKAIRIYKNWKRNKSIFLIEEELDQEQNLQQTNSNCVIHKRQD